MSPAPRAADHAADHRPARNGHAHRVGRLAQSDRRRARGRGGRPGRLIPTAPNCRSSRSSAPTAPMRPARDRVVVPPQVAPGLVAITVVGQRRRLSRRRRNLVRAARARAVRPRAQPRRARPPPRRPLPVRPADRPRRRASFTCSRSAPAGVRRWSPIRRGRRWRSSWCERSVAAGLALRARSWHPPLARDARALSSVGRAFLYTERGRRFEPVSAHHRVRPPSRQRFANLACVKAELLKRIAMLLVVARSGDEPRHRGLDLRRQLHGRAWHRSGQSRRASRATRRRSLTRPARHRAARPARRPGAVREAASCAATRRRCRRD